MVVHPLTWSFHKLQNHLQLSLSFPPQHTVASDSAEHPSRGSLSSNFHPHQSHQDNDGCSFHINYHISIFVVYVSGAASQYTCSSFSSEWDWHHQAPVFRWCLCFSLWSLQIKKVTLMSDCVRYRTMLSSGDLTEKTQEVHSCKLRPESTDLIEEELRTEVAGCPNTWYFGGRVYVISSHGDLLEPLHYSFLWEKNPLSDFVISGAAITVVHHRMTKSIIVVDKGLDAFDDVLALQALDDLRMVPRPWMMSGGCSVFQFYPLYRTQTLPLHVFHEAHIRNSKPDKHPFSARLTRRLCSSLLPK